MFEKVQSMISELMGIDKSKIKPECNFIDDLKADSLDIVQMLIAMENEFGIEFDDAEMQNIKTVGDGVKFIEKHKG